MKKIILGIVLMFAVVPTACESYLDINTNPNYPASAKNRDLLSSAELATTATVGCDFQLVGSLWSQAYTQSNASNQYNTTVNYNLGVSDYQRNWTNTYARQLADLSIIIKQAEANKEWNYWLIAQVMTAYNYQIITDWYGDCPYTESIKGIENLTPKYDDSKSIYAGILQQLDDAIAKQTDAKGAEQPLIDKYDFVYNGDIDKWVLFAKTLKLKILLRDFTTNQAKISALLSETLLTSDAGFIGVFQDKENNSNPLYENDRRKLNTPNNLKGCVTMVDFLNTNNDSRVTVYYEKNSDGKYKGLLAGDKPPTSVTPPGTVSRAMIEATDNVYFLSEVESYFLQAEAYARLADATNAKIWYDKAVKAAFSRWGLDGSTFVATGGAYELTETTTDAMLLKIMTQKWVASVRCQAMEAFFDINRTGIPSTNGSLEPGDAGYVYGNLTPVVGSVLKAGEYPKRLLRPKISADNNPNAPLALPITSPLWWQK